jgi:hypothetical protein
MIIAKIADSMTVLVDKAMMMPHRQVKSQQLLLLLETACCVVSLQIQRDNVFT